MTCNTKSYDPPPRGTGQTSQQDIYSNSSVDGAMRGAFCKMRHFLMTTQGMSEDEAITLMSVAADFGITQVVDGNWGVHGVIQKEILPPSPQPLLSNPTDEKPLRQQQP
ncbi:MAG: hypothetical protein AB4040_15585 [Synechococcus sp.]